MTCDLTRCVLRWKRKVKCFQWTIRKICLRALRKSRVPSYCDPPILKISMCLLNVDLLVTAPSDLLVYRLHSVFPILLNLQIIWNCFDILNQDASKPEVLTFSKASLRWPASWALVDTIRNRRIPGFHSRAYSTMPTMSPVDNAISWTQWDRLTSPMKRINHRHFRLL